MEDNNTRECNTCGMIKSLHRFYKGSKRCRACNRVDCEECGSTFANAGSLRCHVKAVHEGVKEWKCEYCNYRVAHRSNLRTHACYAIGNGNRTPTTEKQIQERFEAHHNASKVTIEAGQVDIVADGFIMEIKNWIRWKEAMGQILIYGLYYPRKEMRVHLFGVQPSADKIRMIRRSLAAFNVRLTYE